MEFIKENWEQILAVVSGIIATASAVAAMTPTPKDDGIVKKLYKLVDLLALNIGKAKEKGRARANNSGHFGMVDRALS